MLQALFTSVKEEEKKLQWYAEERVKTKDFTLLIIDLFLWKKASLVWPVKKKKKEHR